MNYTKEELIASLRAADHEARTSTDAETVAVAAEAVDDLTRMLDALESEKPVEGYDPAAFTSPENYRQTTEAMSETIADVPVFAKELSQEFADPANPEAALAMGLSKRGLAGTGLELVGLGAKLGAMTASEFVPDSVEKTVVDNLSTVGTAIAENPYMQSGIKSAEYGFDAYMTWKNDNPRAGRAMESVFNVAEMFAPPLTRKPISTEKSTLRTLADEQYGRAIELETGKRRDFLNTVITPVPSTANDLKRAERMELDEKGRKRYINEPDEEEMVNVLSGIDDIKQGEAFTSMKTTIENEVEITHNALNKRLGKSKVTFNKPELVAKLKKITEQKLKENPVLTGDANAVASKIFNKALRLLAEADNTPVGVMNVRRELDAWSKKQGKKSYDGNENAWTVANRSIRDFLNDTVAEAVPETEVLEKLRRQHLLLRAKDRILPKVRDEYVTKLGRQLQNFMKATDTKVSETVLGRVGTVSVAASVLGGATFLNMLPALTGLAAVGTLGYVAYRGSVSPSIRRTLSQGLREIDNVLAKKSLGNEMRKALQADRVVFVELMKLPTAPEGADEEAEEEEVVQ
jgi:hypothetical protein